jgi:hypothetical protein
MKDTTLDVPWWRVPRPETDDANQHAVARVVTNFAESRERAQVQRRWRNLVYFRAMTGQPTTSQFWYSMSHRPQLYNYYGDFEFNPPRDNQIASCSDVYINRLFRQKVFVNVVPERGNFAQRQQSKGLEQWLDGALDDYGFWLLYPLVGKDALENGTGWVKFQVGDDKKPLITRPHSDCMLFANPDNGDQGEVIERVWASRQGLLDIYADNDEACDAIRRTPSAYPGFWFSSDSLDCRDSIPLLDAYYCASAASRNVGEGEQVATKKGRHVLCIGNYALKDEDYDRDTLPYERWCFSEMSTGVFGQGLAEQLLSLQDELNSYMEGISESHQRFCWGKWMVEAGSGVNERALGDQVAAIVKYTGVKPERELSDACSPDTYEYVNTLRGMMKERAHISEMAVKGEIPRGLNSAPSLERWSQLDDQTFGEQAARLEAFVMRCAYQLISLGAETKPEVRLNGRQYRYVKWDPKWINKKPAQLSAFGSSKVSQTIAGRRQDLEDMLNKGQISRQTFTRYAQIPDIDNLQDVLNAPQEAIDRQLDELLKGEYIPPTPFGDLNYAKAQVEARHCYESNIETPEDILDLYLQYRAAVKDLLLDQATPDAPPSAVSPSAKPVATAGAPTMPSDFGGQQTGPPLIAPAPQLPAPPPLIPTAGPAN